MNLGLTLYFLQALPFLLWDPHFELREFTLTLNGSTYDFLLCVHHIVVIKIDRFGARLGLLKISLKLLGLKLVF